MSSCIEFHEHEYTHVHVHVCTCTKNTCVYVAQVVMEDRNLDHTPLYPNSTGLENWDGELKIFFTCTSEILYTCMSVSSLVCCTSIFKTCSRDHHNYGTTYIHVHAHVEPVVYKQEIVGLNPAQAFPFEISLPLEYTVSCFALNSYMYSTCVCIHAHTCM